MNLLKELLNNKGFALNIFSLLLGVTLGLILKVLVFYII